MCNRFDRMPQRDGRTDGRTEEMVKQYRALHVMRTGWRAIETYMGQLHYCDSVVINYNVSK